MGLEHLPRDENQPVGGWIFCGLPHRNWLEPLLMMSVVPVRLPLVVLSAGRAVRGSWWRRLAVGLVADVDPVWPAGRGARIEEHVAAARRAIESGAVYAIFPEVGRPTRAPALRRLSAGVAVLSARARAPLVPVVFGGTHELYLRRRIVVRVLPPIAPPADGERSTVAAFMSELRLATQAVADAAHAEAEAGAPRRKRWRWLHGPFPRVD